MYYSTIKDYEKKNVWGISQQSKKERNKKTAEDGYARNGIKKGRPIWRQKTHGEKIMAGEISQSKILALVGPTSSGKSEMAVRLAKKFGGEIVSCDSRQIYRRMNLGTGKVEGKWQTRGKQRFFIYKNIIHHCIDSASPGRQYSVDQFKRAAQKAITGILSRGRLPILCGGTMHWIDAVVYNQALPNVPPNKSLRRELSRLSTVDLFEKLKLLDPDRAAVIDWHNPRRLIRALEIVITTGRPVPAIGSLPQEASRGALWIGIKTDQEELYKKIDKRLKQRLKQGLVKEVRNLRQKIPAGGGFQSAKGLSWRRLEKFGLEYRHTAWYLQKKVSYDEMFRLLSLAIKHYSRRQLTWWKKNPEIRWIKNYSEAEKLVSKFIF